MLLRNKHTVNMSITMVIANALAIKQKWEGASSSMKGNRRKIPRKKQN